MTASDFVCSCAAPGGPNQLGSISESKVVSSVLFGDSEHGIIETDGCLLNLYFTSAAGMHSVFGAIGINNTSDISADHLDDTFENGLPSLMVFYTVSFIGIIIIVPLLSWGVHSWISLMSCFTGLYQCVGLRGSCRALQNRKSWSVRCRWSHQKIFCSLLLFMTLMQGSADAASTSADGSLSSRNIAVGIQLVIACQLQYFMMAVAIGSNLRV